MALPAAIFTAVPVVRNPFKSVGTYQIIQVNQRARDNGVAGGGEFLAPKIAVAARARVRNPG
jgi:hypothetical protein